MSIRYAQMIDTKKLAAVAAGIALSATVAINSNKLHETQAAFEMAAPVVIHSESDKTVGYRDPVGIPTAGVGHTGRDVVVGKFYDDATRLGWLAGDLAYANATVDRCAPATITVYQRAAFISFAFNVGPGRKGVKDGFCVLKKGGRPSFLRKAWAGDVAGSCNGLLAWDNPKNLPGLKKRRKAERDLCITPVPSTVTTTA
jgi:lysozyme